MHFDDESVQAGASQSRTGLRLRAVDDRWCPSCDEVALAFDVEAGQPRCRSCGALD